MKNTFTLTAGLTAALTFGLLKTLRAQIAETSEHIGSLQSSVRRADVDWRGQAPILDNLRNDVNTMGATLAGLEKVRDSASPEEQRAIGEAGALLNRMAADTSAAIRFLNANQRDFWMPGYQDRVLNLVHEYGEISKVVGESVRLAELRAKEKHLETAIGM